MWLVAILFSTCLLAWPVFLTYLGSELSFPGTGDEIECTLYRKGRLLYVKLVSILLWTNPRYKIVMPLKILWRSEQHLHEAKCFFALYKRDEVSFTIMGFLFLGERHAY